MGRFHAVDVDVDEQAARGAEPIEPFGKQRAVGAEINVPFPGNDPLDQLSDLRIDQGLAAADAHDGRPALVNGGEQSSTVNRWLTVAAVFASARNRCISDCRRGGFEHQDQGETLAAGELLPHQVGGHHLQVKESGNRMGKPSQEALCSSPNTVFRCLKVNRIPSQAALPRPTPQSRGAPNRTILVERMNHPRYPAATAAVMHWPSRLTSHSRPPRQRAHGGETANRDKAISGKYSG